MPRIDFESLSFRNAGLYREQVDLNLSKQGRVLLLGDSGTGKTTLWNVLTHVLWGRTDSGAKNKEIVGPDGDYWAKVCFRIRGHSYSIEQWRDSKSQKKKAGMKIKRDGRDDTPYLPNDQKKYVADQLDYQYNQFVGTSYVPQRAVHTLVTGRPAERMEYLTYLFGLEIYDDLIGQVKLYGEELIKGLDGLLRAKAQKEEVEQTLDGIEDPSGQLAKLEKRVAKLSKRLKRSIRSNRYLHRLAEIESMEQEITETEPPKQFEKKLRKLKSKMNLLKRRDGILGELEGAIECSAIRTDVLDRVGDRAYNSEALLREARTDYKRLKGLDSLCPTCLREYPELDRRPVLEALEKTIETRKGVSKRVQLLLSRLQSEHNGYVERKRLLDELSSLPGGDPDTCLKDIKLTRKKLIRARESESKKTVVGRLREALPKVDAPVKTPKKKIDRMEWLRDDLISNRGKLRGDADRRESLWVRMKALDRQIVNLSKIEAEVQFMKDLVVVLKRVKDLEVASLIDEMRNLLPVYVAQVLGRPMELDVRETPRGGIEILEIRDGKPVPLRIHSGGEIDAFTLAFVLTLRVMQPTTSNLLILDEVGLGLDRSKKRKLAGLLEMLPVPSVFCSSHDDILSGNPIWNKVYMVVNDRKIGSALEEHKP